MSVLDANAAVTGDACVCDADLNAAPLASPIDTLDPRTRLLAAAAFALVVVGVNAPAALVLALGLAAGLGAAARLSLTGTLRKLAALDGFMVMALITLPFTVPGEAWLSVAGLPASWQGVERAAVILLKGNAVVLAILALVGTMEPVVLGRAMARLGAPEKLVHLYAFTIRYLDVLQREYARLRTAMKARAFSLRADRHTWRSVGWLFGMLMVRSIERAERIMAAMRCRGFDGRLWSLQDDGGFRRTDGVFALASTAGLALLVVVGSL
ncbi:cobalt/nickel transport system permease protein [Rhodopseudomonas rhenobacensis]|uniref:Cobalt/nickel transport system permease protein n=1 Tax=Rhodopseudomonas rhenobacensis TaxID=87461 RepID=A0A7W8DYY1_9BRAD|nr:cobalt ECF transporter T component CbiQ [Rhodopseudomonas rhenobacensis]MBB5047418.1 cobalt/nickel transport system permease protein [Rhodopseudomonas rhenobacensis]